MADAPRHGLLLRNGQNANRLVRQTGKSNLHENAKFTAHSNNITNFTSSLVQPAKLSKIAPSAFTVYEDPVSPKNEPTIDENNVIHLLERKCKNEKLNINNADKDLFKQRRPLASIYHAKRENHIRDESEDEELFSTCSYATDASVRNNLCNLDVSGTKNCETSAIHVDDDDTEDFQSLPDKDVDDHHNLLYGCPQFDIEIYDYMRDRETKVRPKPDFLKEQNQITSEMRHILIDWLSDVVSEYNMCQETLHLSISLVDRSLSRFRVEKDRLQLVGATALMIAAKFEEIYPPEAKDYAYMTNDTYTIKQLLMMERAILMELGFNVSVPTAVWFANRLANFVYLDVVVRCAMEYLLDLTLLDPLYLRFKPSYVAAATLCYANILCGKTAWSEELEQCSGVRLEHLKKICEQLHTSFQKAPTSEHNSIFNRYSDFSKYEVSNMASPTRLPFEIDN